MGPAREQAPIRGYFFFLSGAWVNAEAATDFTFFGVFGLRRSLAAFEATFFEVLSFLDMVVYLDLDGNPLLSGSPVKG